MTIIELKHIDKQFGDKVVLRNFSLRLEPGSVTCLVGPSGSGKSTVLNLLAGLELWDSGQAVLPEGTVLSYVFQEPRLLPWLTVWGNLSFALKGHWHHEQLAHELESVLRGMELWNERHAWPHQLSGGMRQRVALARGLGVPGNLLLLDEPFKGLDPALKDRIMTFCTERWQATRPTVLMVTHDMQEARNLASSIVEMPGQRE